MDFKDIVDFYYEICFKVINNLKLTNTELKFFKAYTYLFIYAEMLSSEKQKQLEKFLEEQGIIVEGS